MAEINFYNIKPTLEDLQSALTELRNDYDSHNHDGSSSRSFQTLGANTVNAATVLIRKTSYESTAAGIWMGLRDGVFKMNLGSATSSMQWDGTNLVVGGFSVSATALTGGTLQTATSGERVVITSPDISIYNAAGIKTFNIGLDNITFYNNTTGVSAGTLSYNGFNLTTCFLTIAGITASSTIQTTANISAATALACTAGDVTGNNFVPNATNSYSAGVNARRFTTIYLVNNPDVSSDRRLKKNINSLNYGLKDILRLEPVSFKLNNSNDDRTKLGFIAQDVFKIMPEITDNADEEAQIISETDTKYGGENVKKPASYRPADIIPILVKSIQELNARIDELEAKIVV